MRRFPDWLPVKRSGKIVMADNWNFMLNEKHEKWCIPENFVNVFNEKFSELKKLNGVAKADRSPSINLKLRIAEKELVTIMRDIKRRYFFVPPLNDADMVSLGLKPKDKVITPAGIPKGTAKVKISFPYSGQLLLHIDDSGTEPQNIKNIHGFKIYYGVFSADEMPPKTGKDLRENIFTRRKKYRFLFDNNDLGKRAYFCIRYENSKGEAGQWGELFSAIIP